MIKALQKKYGYDIIIVYYLRGVFMSKRVFYTELNADKDLKSEKTIILLAVSAILAIFFDGKRKKPEKRKNFIQRANRNYKLANDSVTAYSAHRKKKQIEKELGLKIEKSQPIDIEI